MKFDRSNKIFNLTYVTVGKQIHFGYNRVQLRNGQVNTFGGNIYFAGDGTWARVILKLGAEVVENP